MSYVFAGIRYDNKPNVDFSKRNTDRYELSLEFESKLTFDKIKNSAPYFEYLKDDKVVGWYDAEVQVGYIA